MYFKNFNKKIIKFNSILSHSSNIKRNKKLRF